MAESTPSSATLTSQSALIKLQQFAINGKLTDLQDVVEFLKHPAENVKAVASKTASGIVKENLLSNYKDMTIEMRKKLVLLLESLDPRVIDEISQDLYSDSHERRLNAIQILGLLKKNPRIKVILAILIKDRDVKVRATAVNLLGRLIGPNDFEIILSLLQDPDLRVKANTIEALEQVNNKRLIPVLIRFRKDSNNRIRGNILKALYNLGFTDIGSDLQLMLENSCDLMKATALWVITQIKFSSPLTTDLAGRHVLSDNEMVVRNAKNALIALSTPRASGYLKYLNIN